MKKPQHSRHPWQIEFPQKGMPISASTFICDANDLVVCQFKNGSHPERVANAHLISAAPDLLKALKVFVEKVHDARTEAGVEFRYIDANFCETMELARSAIAKATGDNA